MRKPRRLLEDARYHVAARANRGEMILKPDQVKELFMHVLLRAKERYSFSIENCCIMENHFHLIIKPGKGENLSRIMQWIMSVFAMALNKRNCWKGHVWRDRFFSRIIESFRSFVEIFDYVDNNPVNAGLVLSPCDWRYGGMSWRRRGFWNLIDLLPPFLLAVFPRHSQLALPAP
jgi:putative transposase